MATNENIEVG